MTAYTVKFPERDVDQRRLLGTMLGIPKSKWNNFTLQELQKLASDEGLIEIQDNATYTANDKGSVGKL